MAVKHCIVDCIICHVLQLQQQLLSAGLEAGVSSSTAPSLLRALLTIFTVCALQRYVFVNCFCLLSTAFYVF